MLSFDTDTKEIARLLGINPDPIAPNDGDILKPFGANQLPIPGAADAIALPTLVSVACDNLVIPLDMSVDQGKTPAETDSYTAASVDSLTGIALAKSHEQLQQFANSPEFFSQMSIAFGDDFDVEAAQDLADSLTNGTFQTSPIKVVSAADINGSNGAFAAETNNIYLSSELVADNADNPEAIVSVLLEEIGHYIDSQINISDAQGDEGAIFAGVVQGKVFDAGELQGLKAEDDTATVMLDGKATVIEQDNTLSAARSVTVGSTTSTYRDWVGTTDTNDYYKFTLSNTSNFNLTLNGLSADADVQLLNSSGTQIQASTNSSTAQENISRTNLSAGTYYVRVYPYGTANTNYNLNLTATPVQAQIPTTDWKAEYFNNTNLTGSPVFVENLGSSSQNFSRNWGNGAPTNTPADNFSARMSTQRYLAPGLYKIQAQADDGVRVRVNNQTVIDKWVDQPFVTNSGYFRSNGGNVPVTVDYYERGGGAAINFNITPATKFQDSVNESQQWKATVYSWNSSQGSAPPTNFWEGDYNNPNAIGVINLGSNTRSDGKKGINVDWGSGAPNGDGSRLPHDNFAMRAYTWADFDGSPYKFRVRGDDGFQLLAKNQATGQWYNITPANQWSQAYGAHSEITYTLPAGRYDMHFHQYEGGGNAYLDLSWEKATGGKYQLPYPDGTTYQVYQGNKDGYSHSDQWNLYAWDFGMPEGNTVVATRSGKVVSLYEGSQTRLTSMNGWAQYTNYVLIDHGDGTSSFYSHLKYNSVLPNVGDYVSQNQPIAQSGNTGFSTDPHLHYSVQKTPSYIPPAGFSNTSGYATESLPSSFSDPDVLRKNSNGVPTSPNSYTS